MSIVQDNHIPARLTQTLRRVAANKSGTTRDQDGHQQQTLPLGNSAIFGKLRSL
jgi:hypothetical protein